MDSILAEIELGCALLMLLLSWKTGSKAARLAQGGSVERLHRKTRKLLFWSAYASLPSVLMIVSVLASLPSLEPVFWEERVLLHLPLAAAPLLSVCLLTFPRLWFLWRDTETISGAPLPPQFVRQATSPSLIVPFHMSALGAVTLSYLTLVSPVPLNMSHAIVPILIWLLVSAGLWVLYERRCKQAMKPDASPVTPAENW